jgi:hypothetical protein
MAVGRIDKLIYAWSMAHDLIRFYAACLRRAFGGWHKRIEGWVSFLSLALAGLPLVAKLPNSVQIFADAIPSIVFLVLFLLIVSSRLLLAPYWLYRDQRTEREILEDLRRPRLKLELTDPPVTNSISTHAITSESMAGGRHTTIRGWHMDVVALRCTNIGETTARKCRARIVSAARLQPNGTVDLGVVEAVGLPWSKEDPEGNLEVDIPPFGTARLWVGGVRSHGHVWLFRRREALPAEYHQLLGNPGKYRVVIQLDADDVPTQQVLIEIEGREGPKPQNGLWRGEATVRLVAQGYPVLDPPFAPPSSDLFAQEGP